MFTENLRRTEGLLALKLILCKVNGLEFYSKVSEGFFPRMLISDSIYRFTFPILTISLVHYYHLMGE